jgi:hypothetical protein
MKLNRRLTRNGETRTRTRFALFPVTLSNGDRIWLERYVEDQKFVVSWLPGELGPFYARWIILNRRPYNWNETVDD